MSYLHKGDLVEYKSRRWIAACDTYTKLVRDADPWGWENEMATASGAIRLEPVDGGDPIEVVFCRGGHPLLIERAT